MSSRRAELVGVFPDVEPEVLLLLRREFGRGLVDVLRADAVVEARRVRVALVGVPEGLLSEVEVVAGYTSGAEDEPGPTAFPNEVVELDVEGTHNAFEDLL